ncbi:MAG: hypothetical protein JXA21_17730 [Anaerolineae bacterium]|nr:hypothetical protein [Anaerolineae bacterium]
MAKHHIHQLHVRLIPGQDDDLLHWLATLASLPFGGKTQAIKTALRQGMEASGVSPTQPAAVDLSGWIPEIRRALAAELDERQWATTDRSTPSPEEDDGVADVLAQLDVSLRVDYESNT